MTDLGTTFDCDFEFRSLDEQGHFTGIASAYGIQDSFKSIFDQGSLEPQQLPLPLTYQHDWNQMLGTVSTFENRTDGAYVEGDFNLKVARAKEIYELAKQGAIRGLSHRFNDSVNEYRDGVRHITHAIVSEITLTPIPSNKQAGITSLRSQESDMEEEYDDYDDQESRQLDTSSGWDAGAARAAIKKWATGADGKVDMGKYGQAFLVKGGDKMSEYKFPIKTVKDGKLVVVCRAVQAAEGRLAGSNVSDKAGIAATLKGYAKKCGFNSSEKKDGGRAAAGPPQQIMSDADGAHHHAHTHVGAPAAMDAHNADEHHHHPHLHDSVRQAQDDDADDGAEAPEDVVTHNADGHHHHQHPHANDDGNNHMDGTAHPAVMGSGVEQPMVRSEDEDSEEFEFENADTMLQELDERLGELNKLKDSLRI